MPTYHAIWNDVVIAESAATVLVDGYRYFPAASVNPEHLVASAHRSVCGWKGQASYFDVVAGGQRNGDAAWCYPDPKPEATMVYGHIGFWHGIRIEEASTPSALDSGGVPAVGQP